MVGMKTINFIYWKKNGKWREVDYDHSAVLTFGVPLWEISLLDVKIVSNF